MISICPSCDKKLKLPEGDEGRTIRCPGCKTELIVTADGLQLPEEDNRVRKDQPARRDEEDEPRRSRPRDEEDEDDRPRRSRRQDDEDEDDGPRRRSRRDEEDEDDGPRRRSRKGTGGGVPLWIWLSIGGGVLAITLVVVLLFVFMGGDKIKKGMTEAEVKAALGEPFMKIGNQAVYFDPPISGADLFNPEKLSKIKYVYAVEFEGGKVKDFQKEDPKSSKHMKTGFK